MLRNLNPIQFWMGKKTLDKKKSVGKNILWMRPLGFNFFFLPKLITIKYNIQQSYTFLFEGFLGISSVKFLKF